MRSRKDIESELEQIVNHHTTGDPHNQQIKKLHAITAEVLLEVVHTLNTIDKSLNRIDKNSDKTAQVLDRLNKTTEDLGADNNHIQRWMVGLTVLVVILAALTLIVAFKYR